MASISSSARDASDEIPKYLPPTGIYQSDGMNVFQESPLSRNISMVQRISADMLNYFEYWTDSKNNVYPLSLQTPRLSCPLPSRLFWPPPGVDVGEQSVRHYLDPFCARVVVNYAIRYSTWKDWKFVDSIPSMSRFIFDLVADHHKDIIYCVINSRSGYLGRNEEKKTFTYLGYKKNNVFIIHGNKDTIHHYYDGLRWDTTTESKLLSWCPRREENREEILKLFKKHEREGCPDRHKCIACDYGNCEISWRDKMSYLESHGWRDGPLPKKLRQSDIPIRFCSVQQYGLFFPFPPDHPLATEPLQVPLDYYEGKFYTQKNVRYSVPSNILKAIFAQKAFVDSAGRSTIIAANERIEASTHEEAIEKFLIREMQSMRLSPCLERNCRSNVHVAKLRRAYNMCRPETFKTLR